MAYYESVGLIASLFCLPLLGFLLGRRFTVASLTGERDRQAELENIYTLIDNNRNDMNDQIQTIYDTIEQHQDDVDKELNLAKLTLTNSSQSPYQTTTTA